MKLTPARIEGAYVLELEPIHDERGFFARTWCSAEYALLGLDSHAAQCSISHNARRGTLRGLHYQKAPHAEAKTVRCTGGSLYDVIVDLRPDSPTYKCWEGFTLSAGDGRMLYVPEGVAHGYQTLEDRTEVSYVISRPFEPASARGVRWDDPAFGIAWIPMEELIINERDRQFPLWKEETGC